MEALAKGGVFLFEGFRLDRQARTLFRGDEAGASVPIAIGSRALEVLDVLVGRAGDLVSRDEFMTAVWPTTAVEDTNLNMQIAALRRILDDGRANGSCIQTISGRGYRFVVAVTRVDAPALPTDRQSGNGAGPPLAEGSELGDPVALGQSRLAAPVAPQRRRKRFQSAILAALAGILCLLVAAVTISNWHLPLSTGASSVPRLSIVVLPFADLSKDPDQQYFADGVTWDLTSDLSRMAGTLVISADTALTYKNKRKSLKQVGRELGVRYVVEGSVERIGDQVRINAQLIDAASDTHLWAERFDREISDLFALQTEITGRIAFTLNLELIAAEADRPVEHPDALDYIFRGRQFFFGRPPSRENYKNAIALYEQALRLDPQSIEAKTFLAGALVVRVVTGLTDSRVADLGRAEKLIDEALAAGSRIPAAHYVKGTILRNQGRWDDAMPEFEAALALNRNMTGPLQGLGWCKLFTGSLDQVIPLAEQAIRIGPRDPSIGFRYLLIGYVYQLQSRPEEAIVWFEKARGTISAVPSLWAHLASAHALAGDTERAAAELAEARRLSPDPPSSIARLRAGGLWGMPKVQAMFEATYFAGLRKAGMAEE